MSDLSSVDRGNEAQEFRSEGFSTAHVAAANGRTNVLKSLMKVEVQKPEEFALMRLFACSGKGIIHAAAKAGHEECLEFLRAAIIVEKICKKYPDFKVDLALNTVLEPRGASDTDHTVDEDKIKEIRLLLL